MDVELATWLAACLAALAGGVALRFRRGQLQAAEAELESMRDALWRACEREEQARVDGERALAGADAAARMKSRFLATVTHEMRTPLSGVIGTAELLLDTTLAPDQRTYALAVKSSADAMLSLVDEILDMSRIEADKVVLQAKAFDLADLVEGVAELLAPRAQAKGLDLAVRVTADTPAQLIGDAARLRQILLNLAGNAIKFTETGGVGLRVDRADDGVRFRVVDTGPGFAEADAARIFDEFERAGADAAAPGVGLGLSISARLADAMGGTLTAEATPGEGATFTLTLPAAPVTDAPAPGAGVDHAALEGRRALVVSAAPFAGPWLIEQLQDYGAAARLAAPSSADALAAEVGAFAADTVLIDRNASEWVGDLAHAARRGGARTVVALLAPSERWEAPALSAEGYDGFLIKPVRAGSFLSRLNDPRPIGSHGDGGAVPGVMSFPQRAGLDVLVAEDDAVSALITLAHLHRLGHAVTQAADGLLASMAFEATGFDVVLIDIRMPGLDGHDATRRMRAFERAAGRAPALIVAVTANDADEDVAAALAAGVDHVLAKPLDPGRLATLLEQCRPDPARRTTDIAG